MLGRGVMPALLLAVPVSSAANAAPVEPKSPVHVASNAVFYLCPELVRSHTAPSPDWITPLGLQPNSSKDGSVYEFKATDPRGFMTVEYNVSERRCTLNYAGPGYEQISGMIREVVVRSKLVRITEGDRDGAKADVFEGPVPADPNSTARFIIIENYRQPSAAISYTERASK